MPTKPKGSDIVKRKKELGLLISKCRGKTMSQRQLAAAIGLSPSNMKYIEDGVNCPTAAVYSRLIIILNPSNEQRAKLDKAYMIIRNAPPPDVSDRVIKDQNLIKLIRALGDTVITDTQINQIIELLGLCSSGSEEKSIALHFHN